MENLSRRLFLRQAALAGAVAPISFAHQTEARQIESPAFLRASEDFDVAKAAYIAAMADRAAARQRFDAIAPAIPEELVFDDVSDVPSWMRDISTPERDPEDVRVHRYGREPERRVIDTGSIDYYSRRGGKEYPALEDYRAIAGEYYVRKEAAMQASGLGYALVLSWRAESRLERAARALAATEALTDVGVVTKARAAAFYSGTGNDQRFAADQLFGRSLWTDIVSIFGKEVA